MIRMPLSIQRSLTRMRERAVLQVARLRCSAGFTLTEVLATVIILGLVTSLVATAVTVGVQQFTRSMAASESRMLFSSLQQDLKNDLGYTTTASANDKTGDEWNITGYKSINHGTETDKSLYLKALDSNGAEVPVPDGSVTGYGQLALCSQDGKIKNRLLGKAAYNYGLAASVKKLTYNEGKKLYTVTLLIADGADNDSLVDETFTIRAMVNEVIDQ